MAEVLTKGGLLSPCGNRALGFQSQRRRSPFVSFFPSPSSLETENGFNGGRLVFSMRRTRPLKPSVVCPPVSRGYTIGKAMKWWEKGLQPNMREIESAQDLVDSLLNAGDKLVVVDFFSPGCPGCKALHPKICQFAEANPDALFLQVNHEKHKSMCYSLHVHVLPFFWFFKGSEGRLCGFSCTNQTIKKFKDALAKHGTVRCSLGPTKGLDESALLALASNKELGFSYTKKTESESVPSKTDKPLVPLSLVKSNQDLEEKALVGRI